MSDTKICPFCGEEVPVKAIKCKYCKEWLTEDTPIQSRSQETHNKNKRAIPKWIFITVIILSAILGCFSSLDIDGEIAGLSFSELVVDTLLCVLIVQAIRWSEISNRLKNIGISVFVVGTAFKWLYELISAISDDSTEVLFVVGGFFFIVGVALYILFAIYLKKEEFISLSQLYWLLVACDLLTLVILIYVESADELSRDTMRFLMRIFTIGVIVEAYVTYQTVKQIYFGSYRG